MEKGATAAFWSYCHDDDAQDDGNIRQLSQRLRDEFGLLTGEPLDVFLDRESIEWGDEWRARIDNALVETTFFIPIITPRYFLRPECRRELLMFAGQAESLGLKQLVLPLLYIPVPDVTPESGDEAKALVARTQFVDWTELRLMGIHTAEYRSAVNGLAKRLATVSSEVVRLHVEREVSEQEAADDEAGLVDLVERIQSRFPEWLATVEDAIVSDAQIEATWDAMSRRMHTAPPRARFAIVTRLARAELPLSERKLELARSYATSTAALNPLVLAAIRGVGDHPETTGLLEDVRYGVDEAWQRIQSSQRKREQGYAAIEDLAAKYVHLSQAMRQLHQTLLAIKRYAGEGNEFVSVWKEMLDQLSWPET